MTAPRLKLIITTPEFFATPFKKLVVETPEFTDRVYFLKDGRLVAVGLPA